MIAVIVPANNEERDLGACLASIAQAAAHPALRQESVRTVVVLDDCNDGSAAIAAAHGVETLTIAARCVGAARIEGVKWAIANGARWLCSTDADCLVPPDWIGGQIGTGSDAVCGTVTVEDWLDRAPEVAERFNARYRCHDGHRYVHGANLGISVPAYIRAGGFPPLPTHEDVGLVDRLLKQGARIAWVCHPIVVTSARSLARVPQGFAAFLNSLAAMPAAA